MTDERLPFRPGDWVDNRTGAVATVKRVYRDNGEVLLDLVLYARSGDKIGRASPACGGPRTFEPCCPADHYRRIARPSFPLKLVWVPTDDGRSTAAWNTGRTLPPANWKPPASKGGRRGQPNDRLRRALEQIRDGHNDARGLAAEVLRGGR